MTPTTAREPGRAAGAVAGSALRSWALPAAVGLGVLADLLVRVPGRPGLNLALWALAGVAVLAWLLRRRAEPGSRESCWLLAGALGFAAALALRDADALAVLALFSSLVLLGMAAGRAARAWATRAQVGEVVVAAVRVGVLCLAGPLGWGRGAPADARPGGGWSRQLRTLVRGTLMALPALIVVAALLMSADAVFARVLRQVFVVDLEPLVDHVLFAAAVAWLCAGLLRAFLVDDGVVVEGLRMPRPPFAVAEVVVALWLLNLLFAAFLAVQLRYLFGGADLVEVVPGLTYAEYARRGFFELVATATLVVPLLLLADWAAPTDGPRGHLRATMLLLVVLLVGVIASAGYRMRLYQAAYGLTELRLYAGVFIAWLVVALGWLVLTVLRGRRERFVFGAVMAGLACVAGLHLLNPHALIVRVNIERAAAGAEVDATYLGSLGADAVPTLLTHLEELPASERCGVADMLRQRWSGERAGGWRTWNLGDWRARRRVAAAAGRLSACPAGSSDRDRISGDATTGRDAR